MQRTSILYIFLILFINASAVAQAKKPVQQAVTVSMSAFMERGLTFDPADPNTPVPAEFVVKGLKKGYMPKQLLAVIRHDGEVIRRISLEKAGEYDGLTNFTASAVANYGAEYEPLAAGSYTCDLYIDRKRVFTYPFTISVINNNLPAAQVKEFRLMDGYWSKYGYLSFAKDGRLNWNMYLTSLNPAPAEDLKLQKDYRIEAQLFYNDKAISDVAKQLVWCQRGKWQVVSFAIKNKAAFVNRKQLAADGNYVLKVKVNQEQREYRFEVKNGKIALLPEQDRDKNRDGTKVFEGLGTEFWLKRDE